MADAVWDIKKEIDRAAQGERARCDSEPSVSVTPTSDIHALEIAVPGGFRRHHLNQATRVPPVSKHLRDQIVERITSIYDPFIGSMLSQENDRYDNIPIHQRVQSLLQTPIQRWPYRRTPRPQHTPSSGESTPLMSTPKTAITPRTVENNKKTVTLWHALLTLLKAFVGTGILFLPDGFRSGGMVFSPVCLVVVAAMTLYAMIRLLQCRSLVGGTFGQIGYEAFGPWGRRCVQISIVLMQAGFCCTYVIFVAQNMADVLAYWGKPVSISTLILLQIIVYIPLSWIRYIGYFSISNLVADVFILYGLAFIISNSVGQLKTDGPKQIQYFNRQDYPVFIGTAIFTFEGIGLVLPTQGSLNKARQAKFPGLLIGTVIGLLFFYSFFAGVNYLAYGDDIQPMITSSLPRTGWSISVQFGYSIAQLLSYPLFLFPAVKIMEDMLGFKKRASGQKAQKNCFRATAVLVTVLIAFFGQARLDLFVSLVGAFCCVPLSFIYPPLFYLKLQKAASFADKLFDWVVVLLGTLTFIYVTYSNIRSWVVG